MESNNAESQQNNSQNGPLAVEDWVAWKPGEQQASLLRKQATRYTFEETLGLLETNIKELLSLDDFTSRETRSRLKFIQRQTCYGSDVVLNQRLAEKIVTFGIAHVYLKVWKSVTEIDYLRPENALAFKNLQTALSIIWNCTDRSRSLCDSLIKCGVIQHLLGELASDRLSQAKLGDEDELYLAKAYLGILHNIVRACSDSRPLYRSANAVSILQTHFKSSHNLVKTKAYLILSYIINEKENDIINADTDNIQFIVNVLAEAVESENHFSRTFAFWASELVCGLNHLAVNDSNKIQIAKSGALSLYTTLIAPGGKPEEQNHAAAGLWILAFRNENKILINEEPGCVDALRALVADSPHEGIRRAARGALWVLASAPSQPIIQTEQKNPDLPHVMISYHWAQSKPMQRLGYRLKQAGYKVWMDIDNMSGSTLEAMALAVEQAAVVLVGLSQGYKDSPSCRTEAEYAFRLRKEVIPILLQPGYVPDGWVGALVGSRLYFDFTTETNGEINMARLMKEVGLLGKFKDTKGGGRSLEKTSLMTSLATSSTDTLSPRSNVSRLNTPRSVSQIDWGEEGMCSLSSSTSSLHSYIRPSTPAQWSTEEVKKWLHLNHLGHASPRFDQFTGDLLLEYKKMMETAPEYFYNSLERHLQMDLVSSLRFSKALASIS